MIASQLTPEQFGQYYATYRVREHIPVSALGKLPAEERGLHRHHDLAPVNSLVVSRLGPTAYYEGITSQPAAWWRSANL